MSSWRGILIEGGASRERSYCYHRQSFATDFLGQHTADMDQYRIDMRTSTAVAGTDSTFFAPSNTLESTISARSPSVKVIDDTNMPKMLLGLQSLLAGIYGTIYSR